MEKCVNTILINKHYEEQEKDEKALENFLEEIKPFLLEIENAKASILRTEDFYEGYDFTDEIKEAILEIL